MNKLIDAFISMSRISRSELKVEPVNLGKLAEEIVSFLRASDPQRVVEVVIAADLTASGDERLLRIGLENLLSNAWKFTARKACARGSKWEPPRARARRFTRSGITGPASMLGWAHKLFHAFERLRPGNQFEGPGVGLSTVQRGIEKHVGRIWAESVLGEGATFYFTLGATPRRIAKGDGAVEGHGVGVAV